MLPTHPMALSPSSLMPSHTLWSLIQTAFCGMPTIPACHSSPPTHLAHPYMHHACSITHTCKHTHTPSLMPCAYAPTPTCLPTHMPMPTCVPHAMQQPPSAPSPTLRPVCLPTHSHPPPATHNCHHPPPQCDVGTCMWEDVQAGMPIHTFSCMHTCMSTHLTIHPSTCPASHRVQPTHVPCHIQAPCPHCMPACLTGVPGTHLTPHIQPMSSPPNDASCLPNTSCHPPHVLLSTTCPAHPPHIPLPMHPMHTACPPMCPMYPAHPPMRFAPSQMCPPSPGHPLPCDAQHIMSCEVLLWPCMMPLPT